MSDTPIISLTDVACGYPGAPVLDDLSLALAPGAYLGIVGPSGAGKTTLLRTLMGEAVITRGQGSVNGTALRRGAVPPQLGYVPQLETVDWTFPVTVGQAVLMGRTQSARWQPWASAEERAALAAVLDRLGLSALVQRHIHDLSGGQQQRVFLARALIRHPRILLLDEPTSGIDVKTRQAVLALLAELNQEGMTIILTTHDLTNVAATLPQVACINRTLIAQGPPEAVLTSAILSQTYQAPLTVLRHAGHLIVAELDAAGGAV
jgi:ABC-type Mn2+/Zn2+ transport system ATPase subunit